MSLRGNSYWTSGAVPLIEPEFLGSIISAASDIALVVSAEGIILSVLVNSNDDSFGNLAHWEGRGLVEFLTSESVEKFEAAHSAFLAGGTISRPVELNHSDNAVWHYPVRYSFHRFGQEDCALMLGRDLQQIAETQQQLVQAQIAIEQGYEARREFDARYRVMLGQVEDAVVFVEVSSGRIDEANENAAALLGLKTDALRGANFGVLFSDRSGAELTESLVTATLADETQQIVVQAARTGRTLHVSPTLFRAGGQRVIMCLLTPERDVSAGVADEGDIRAGRLFRESSDAMLFVSGAGDILGTNDAFIDLIGATRKSDVTGSNLADVLARGQIDLGLMLGNAGTPGQMRVYATRLVNRLGGKVGVEVSITRLEGADAPLFGLVMRDVNRLEPVREKRGDGQSLPETGQKVVELVGSATLKEIVAETTDVVEKLCIETAVTLTRNNRVAAAEMLGLSRQSLYVKLRKFGLLSRD